MKKISDIKKLELIANELRQDLITMLTEAGSGHSAGPLDLADLMSAMYFNLLNHRPEQPMWEGRDRLIFSAGHNVPIRYVAMAHSGYFPKKELNTLRKLGSKLQGHPSIHNFPAMETSTGPLGQGISVGVGMALAARLDGKRWRTYVVMGDGELDEGQCWEAFMLAAKERLNNLTVFVDRNNIQIDGFTEDVMPLDSLQEKSAAFNWNVINIDGHNIESIIDAVNLAKAVQEKPSVVILNTIPGKGVSFMEGKFEWHGKPPKRAEAKKALNDLRTLRGNIDNTDHN